MDTYAHKVRCCKCKKTIKISFNTIGEFIKRLEKAGWYDKPAPDPRDGILRFCKECKVAEFAREERVYQDDCKK